MNDVLKCLMECRSIRKYTAQQVSDDLLEQILYAASFGPNTGNRQTTQIRTSWGIRDGYEVKVHILLGYSAGGWPDTKDCTYSNPVVIR